MRFRLIDAAKKEFLVQRLCQVLGVSPSGYFAWKDRPACRRHRTDMVLLAHVRSAFAVSNGTYGSPRMVHELRDNGLWLGRRRVARLMRENGMKARQKRQVQSAAHTGCVRHFVMIEKNSQRDAARVFGLSRETVSKMCQFSAPPGYTRSKPVAKPKLGPLLPVIHPSRTSAAIRVGKGWRSILEVWSRSGFGVLSYRKVLGTGCF